MRNILTERSTSYRPYEQVRKLLYGSMIVEVHVPLYLSFTPTQGQSYEDLYTYMGDYAEMNLPFLMLDIRRYWGKSITDLYQSPGGQLFLVVHLEKTVEPDVLAFKGTDGIVPLYHISRAVPNSPEEVEMMNCSLIPTLKDVFSDMIQDLGDKGYVFQERQLPV